MVYVYCMMYIDMRYEQSTYRVFTEIKISRVFNAIYPVTPARGTPQYHSG
jgi:hypothetical protein